MNSRYRLLIPTYAHDAFETWYAYGANDEVVEEFAGKWGGCSSEHFLRAVEAGRGDDRLCAMFALGASTHPDAVHALLPFLHSVRRDERCISAIALAMRGETESYPALEKQLLEGLSLEERVAALARDDQEMLEELFVCDRFRYKAVKLLEGWHSPTLIQTMIQALESLWTLEKTSTEFFPDGQAYDALCYALGQRGVFTALDQLDFVPEFRRIAMVYLAIGALQVYPEPTFMRSVLGSKQRVQSFLEETFHLDGEEAQKCIETFYGEGVVRRAYRADLMQEREERPAEPFLETLNDDDSLENSEEETPEEPIAQREPKRTCVYRGHTDTIWSLAWSPDGGQIVSGSADTTAQVWNRHTCKRILLFQGHQAGVTVVAWSPDGQWIASAGCDNTVCVWNARTGEAITVYTKQRAWICNGLAWSPDGQWIASASWDGSVHIWEAMTGETRLRYHGHQGVITCVAWSPDGTQIASGGGYPEGALHVWNAITGQLNFVYTAHMQDQAGTRLIAADLHGSYEEAWARGPSSIRSVVWSPDGRWIASVGLRGVFRVWDARTGEDLIALLQHRYDGPLAWSADSQYLATGTGHENGVDIWSIAQKHIIFNYTPASRSTVTTLEWSPDGSMLATAGESARASAWKVDM